METSPQESVRDETLAESRQRYASLFTYHPHATYSLDLDGNFTDANSRGLEMTGLTLEELRRTNFAQVVHPDDLPLVQDGFERALAGEAQEVEGRIARADDTIVHFRTTAIPVVVDEVIVGVHGVTEDVTHAKQVLRELEEANAAKALFLATVSHELRTPLAALVGATDLLIDSALDPEQQHYVDMVDRSARRMTQLVNDMLEFSCLQARRTAPEPRVFDVHTVVDSIHEWATPLAESGGLRASFDIDDSVPQVVVGDGVRVSQVVSNLVHNAIKFTERGGVDVCVTARDHETEGDVWVEFRVSDTGIGIAPERVRSLFEPFSRADVFTGREHLGSGLGLAICRDLVDLMDGRLQASSEVGSGSTFTFGVPLGRAS